MALKGLQGMMMDDALRLGPEGIKRELDAAKKGVPSGKLSMPLMYALGLQDMADRVEKAGARPPNGTVVDRLAQEVQAAREPRMPEGGVASMPVNSDMYDEHAMAAGGIVAFGNGGAAEDAGLEELWNKLLMAESGNQDYYPPGHEKAYRRVTSPSGALYAAQVLPSTARKPGFGIAPAKEETPEEYNRVGKDYIKAMVRRYGNDPYKALAAYNAGPGIVDKLLTANEGELPLEALPNQTRKYVSRIGYGPTRMGGESVGSAERVVAALDNPPAPATTPAATTPAATTPAATTPAPTAPSPAGRILEGLVNNVAQFGKDTVEQAKSRAALIQMIPRNINPLENQSDEDFQAAWAKAQALLSLATDPRTTKEQLQAALADPNTARLRDILASRRPAAVAGAKPEYVSGYDLPMGSSDQRQDSYTKYVEAQQGRGKQIDPIEALLAQGKKDASERDRKMLALAIMQGGLGTLAGRSPFAVQNIAAGNAKGLGTYIAHLGDANKARSEELKTRLELYKAGEARQEQKQMDIKKALLSDVQKYVAEKMKTPGGQLASLSPEAQQEAYAREAYNYYLPLYAKEFPEIYGNRRATNRMQFDARGNPIG